jgi:hypothetical protein
MKASTTWSSTEANLSGSNSILWLSFAINDTLNERTEEPIERWEICFYDAPKHTPEIRALSEQNHERRRGEKKARK